MPSAMEYVPATDRRRGGLLGLTGTEARKRAADYDRALKYYLGQQASIFEKDDIAYDYEIRSNLIRMAADRTAQMLFPELPKFIIDKSGLEETPEEQLLRRVFRRNGGLHLLTRQTLQGFLAGHSFLLVSKKPDEEVKITLLHPASVSIYWRADDISEVLWYEHRFTSGKDAYIRDYVKEGDNWVIYEYVSEGVLDDILIEEWLESYREQFQKGNYTQKFVLKRTYVHQSKHSPLIAIPHLPDPSHNMYGLSEATKEMLRLQDAINRIASERFMVASENAQPVDVIIGAGAEGVADEGALVTIENPAAKVQRLEMRGDLKGMTETLQDMSENFLAQVRVVLLKGEAKDLQRVTNAAVRTLFLDALSKNAVLQDSYGEGLRKLAIVVLDMYGMAAPDEESIEVEFAYPLPVDATEIANENAIMTNIGARSLTTANTKMGDNPQFEFNAMLREAEFKRKLAEIAMPPSLEQEQNQPEAQDPQEEPEPEEPEE